MLISLSSGDPAGIGPELSLRLTQAELPCPVIVHACPELLASINEQFNLGCDIHLYDRHNPPQTHQAGQCWVAPIPLTTQSQLGQANAANAHYVLACLEQASYGCAQGEFQALVTAPISKAVICQAGIDFSGHTEWLANYFHCQQVVMMLATAHLNVALATTHIPLKQVASQLNQQRLVTTLRIIEHDLRQRFGIHKPAIAVCGLNPHAGEQGMLGREEIDIISPAIDQCRHQWHIDCQGPFSADTIFVPKISQRFDVILAMYHDQGLPVLKYSGFGEGINITLGLPIIRTSVDHGTAFDIANTGTADVSSLLIATQKAFDLSSQQVNNMPSDELSWNWSV